MAITFDEYDWESYFVGPMTRGEVAALLADQPVGSFFVRTSSRAGDYSLSVREATEGEHQFTNYLIERKEEDGKLTYEMNGIPFVSIPNLLAHYKLNKLNQTCLWRPAHRPCLARVIALHKFEGERTTDLPFERGEVLEVIGRPESGWWIARNALKISGLIPSTFIKEYDDGDEVSLLNPSTATTTNSSSNSSSANNRRSNNSILEGTTNTHHHHHHKRSSQPPERERSPPQTPAWVRVVADRHPSIYDQEALVIKMLYLTEVIANGMCRGENEERRVGLFPFTYVEWTTIPLSAGPWAVPASS